MNIFGMVTTAKSSAYTTTALESFFRNTPFESIDQFFLIDNDGAFDESILKNFPLCSLIRNPSPYSFSKNANQILAKAERISANFYFLNNDVIFTPNWLIPLLAHEAAILSPLCNREVQYASSVVVTSTSHILDMFLLKMSMNLEEYLGHESALQHIAVAHQKAVQGFLSVFVLPFFCVKIPPPVYQALGAFDESFGIGGGEDFDYCLRAHLAGFDVRYALASYNLHFGGKSTWSGAESQEQQSERENRFRSVFRSKWGEALHDLILKEDESVLTSFQATSSTSPSISIQEKIMSLLGLGQVDLKLPLTCL